MATPLDQAFHDYVLRITPSRAELETIGERAEKIETAVREIAGNPTEVLQATGGVDVRYIGTSAFGSAQRGTLIRPLEKIDMDMILAFEATPAAMVQFNDGQNFLRAMLRLLERLPGKHTLFEGECIRIDLGEPPLIDIFVGIDWFGNRAALNFPHGPSNSWFRSSPQALDRWVMERNGAMGKRLIPFLRMLKVWNRLHGAGLRSFHLERMTAVRVRELHGYWPIELGGFFAAGAMYGAAFLSVTSADGFLKDMAADLSDGQKQKAVTQFARAAVTMGECLRAMQARDLPKAVSCLREVLGPDFPDWEILASTYGYDPHQAAYA